MADRDLKHEMLVACRHSRDAYTDVWGTPQPGEVLQAATVVWLTDETVTWNNGYSEQTDTVWVDRDGTRFQKVNDDIGGMGYHWKELVPKTGPLDLLDPTSLERPERRWETARPRRPYVLIDRTPMTVAEIKALLDAGGYFDPPAQLASQ